MFHDKEFSILYTYNTEEKEGSLSKWGNSETTSKRMKEIQAVHATAPEVFATEQLHVVTFKPGKVPVELLTRFLDTTFLIGIFHRGFVLGEEDCQQRIQKIIQHEGSEFKLLQ